MIYRKLISEIVFSRPLTKQGGGSSGLFEPAAEVKPHARPKYDQQNSSNLNFCMGTVDPNIKVQQLTGEKAEPAAPSEPSPAAVAAAPAERAEISAPKQEANLPQYHHHRSTALW